MKIAIVDYGAGNNSSVCNALIRAGAEPVMAATPEAVLAAERLVLPGVGGAAAALERLRAGALDQALDEAVRKHATPMLGICLGLQMLADDLLEDGRSKGLGWIRGKVVDLHELLPSGLRVPHMGWNQVTVNAPAERFFADVTGRRDFYFCHSFALTGNDQSVVAAATDYGAPVVAAVLHDTVFATQFHPEKSQINGQRVIESFLRWTP